jgi:hypothetical protein
MSMSSNFASKGGPGKGGGGGGGGPNKGNNPNNNSSSSSKGKEKEEEEAPVLAANELSFTRKGIEAFEALFKHHFPTMRPEFIADYARCACLLNDTDAVLGTLWHLDRVIYHAIQDVSDEIRQKGFSEAQVLQMLDPLPGGPSIICSGQEFRRLNELQSASASTASTSSSSSSSSNSNMAVPPPTAPIFKLSVSKVLKRCFERLNAQGLQTSLPCSIFADAAEGNGFDRVVRAGCLFLDGVATGHGDYTHMLQWLVIAAARAFSASLGTQVDFVLINEIGDLYKASVDGASKGELAKEKSGTPCKGHVTPWDLVLDGFVMQSGQEDTIESLTGADPDNAYESLFCSTFRSPRMLQYGLYQAVDDEKFEVDLKKINVPKVAPLLCALIRNRARYKGLGIDCHENKFKNTYAAMAEAKAERFSDGAPRPFRTELNRGTNTQVVKGKGGKEEVQKTEGRPSFIALPKDGKKK